MKRKISIFLVLILCFCCWAEPVSAAEVESGTLINVLDFATANESGYNRANADSTTNVATCTYRLPTNYVMRYVDMVVNSMSGDLVTCSINGTAMTVEKIQSRLFRVYGVLGSSATALAITFTGDTLSNDFAILSLNVSAYASLAYDIEGYCSITASGWSGTDIHYVPTDTVNYRMFTGDVDPYNAALSLFLWSDDWKKYDYIDFQLMLEIMSINSISAVMGNTNVPLDICYVDPPSYISNTYYVTLRMYTGQLDKSINDYPMIILNGSVIADKTNLVSVMNISGHVDVNNVDPVSYWLYTLNRNLNTYITNQTNQLVSEFSALQSINDSGFKNISSAISSLSTTVSNGFTNVGTWISDQTTSLVTSITGVRTAMMNQFSVLRSELSGHFTNLQTWIQTQTDELVTAILGDAHAGDDFQQDVDEKDQELDEMGSVMDSVTRPDIDDMDLSVSGHGVYQSAIASVTSPFLVFLTGDIFGNIAFMVIMLSTIGYALFGKR